MSIRKVILWMLCMVMILGLVGCGKAMDNVTGNAGPGEYISKEEVSTDTQSASGLPENRKLIQTVNMDVETEDLDTVLQQIDSRIAELNGYIESSNVQNGSAYSSKRYRKATITVRIPAKDLDAFVDKVDEVSNIVSSRKTVQDVTLSYVATESRMKALETEQARLLELLAKAETMDDLLTVEKRLTEVRTELEEVTSALKVFDNQVDFATIHLNIQEVKEYTEITEPETVWQRIGTGFMKSLKGVGNFFKEFFVFIIVSIPYFALIGLVIFVVVYIIRRSRRKRRNPQMKEDPKEKP